jgi:membrane-associated phospholipid phosphatase
MRAVLRSSLRFGLIQFAIVLAAGYAINAQTPTPSPSPAPPTLEREFFKNILRDQKAIWTAPFHVERADAKWMVPSGIGLLGLITTDRITGDEISEFHSQVKPSKIISYAGSTYAVGAIAATFYVVGRHKHDTRARETGMLVTEGLVDSWLVVSALKGITQRGRPQTGHERSEFFDGGDSFPSGHSIQAWSVATIVAHEYHDRPIVQVASYGIASAVSLARFTGGRHYLSDVLVGSALGYGIGRYIYRAHHRQSSNAAVQDEIAPSSHLVIAPQFNHREHEYGLALQWSF